MTITGSSNESTQTYDICPKGWRLPTNDEFSGITISDYAFNPVTSGRYYNGSLQDTAGGYWWSATSYEYDATSRYTLIYISTGLLKTYNIDRNLGHSVRCIRSS